MLCCILYVPYCSKSSEHPLLFRSLLRALIVLQPCQILHGAPVQEHYGQNDGYVHDLVTVKPVVEGARAEALRDTPHVDQATGQSQNVHDDVKMKRFGVSCAELEPAQGEEESPEQGLEGERSQAASAALSSQRVADTAAREEHVAKHGSATCQGLAQESDVHDWQSTCR